jgi:glucose-1-phosphate adenylyltransferase
MAALPDRTFALVLAGGAGTRLGLLTRHESKPALPFAGHLRNIDFTLSNCVNSGVHRIAVLTQHRAQTLHDHVSNRWNAPPRASTEFVDLWPAQPRAGAAGYAGTANAVFQNLAMLESSGAPYTLVLAGDHIYTMDYRPLLQAHVARAAAVTIGCVTVPVEQASAFGVLEAGTDGRARSFVEKPPMPSLGPASDGRALASMGIYVFDTSFLADALRRDAEDPRSSHDFGRDVLPAAVRESHVHCHLFLDRKGAPGYWRDVGTLEAYWQAHMDLLSPTPAVDLWDPSWPIGPAVAGSHPRSRTTYGLHTASVVSSSLVTAGAVVHGATVSHSVLSTNVVVGEDSAVEEAVVLPNARIGANCRLRRVIVESGTEVPDGTIIGWGQVGCGGPVTLVARDGAARGLRSVA